MNVDNGMKSTQTLIQQLDQMGNNAVDINRKGSGLTVKAHDTFGGRVVHWLKSTLGLGDAWAANRRTHETLSGFLQKQTWLTPALRASAQTALGQSTARPLTGREAARILTDHLAEARQRIPMMAYPVAGMIYQELRGLNLSPPPISEIRNRLVQLVENEGVRHVLPGQWESRESDAEPFCPDRLRDMARKMGLGDGKL